MTTLIVGTSDSVGPVASAIACLHGSFAEVERFVPGGAGWQDSLADRAEHAEQIVLCLPAGESALAAELSRTLGPWRGRVRTVRPIDEQLERADAPPAWVPRADPSCLLERPPRPIDRELVGGIIRGKRVLITGAGGSIGSELALSCAAFGPSRLVLVERSENALFEIDRRIGAGHRSVERRAVLHDVVDAARTRALVELERPDVVFHAAAHKHVPLMEEHPADAVQNNLIGTASIARASADAGVGRFVLVSTDKAVRPSSVMGATKRLAERFVQGLAARAGAETGFAIVRFGNVIGSAGSVVPVWAAQLAEGGPITVTDERMTRYFMTIPEAASLVTQAAAMTPTAGGSASVYVLDMGAPVRIIDLAERFVRRSGFEPVRTGAALPAGPAMEIAVTGIRPGEKLHEELRYSNEELLDTAHPAVRRLDDPEPATWQAAEAMLAKFEGLIAAGEPARTIEAVRRAVRMRGADSAAEPKPTRRRATEAA